MIVFYVSTSYFRESTYESAVNLVNYLSKFVNIPDKHFSG